MVILEFHFIEQREKNPSVKPVFTMPMTPVRFPKDLMLENVLSTAARLKY
jgi:hypothetical protein